MDENTCVQSWTSTTRVIARVAWLRETAAARVCSPFKSITAIKIPGGTYARSHVTWCPHMYTCACVRDIRYTRLHTSLIFLSSSFHLFFLSFHSPTIRDFFDLDHSPSSFIGLFLSSFAPAFPRVSSSLPPPPSLSLAISDLIRFVVQCCSRCDYMPEVPCSPSAMPELRRRVSLQSTTLLGRRLSWMIDASSRIMILLWYKWKRFGFAFKMMKR